jgi:tetratricopeptide (TPR) repeat protein/SAM-dependent methyltransferase
VSMLARADILLEPIDRTASIVEIGPSYYPIAPKVKGWNTKIIDVATKYELIEKYRHEGVDVGCIEDVDFIWRNGPLSAAVPSDIHGSFDAFIASHVIEHAVDIVDFLNGAATLLKPTGVVVLAIPDKRFCFDYFRPFTLTGDMLYTHTLRRTRHSKQKIFDYYGYIVRADNSICWGQHYVNNFTIEHSLERAYSEFLTRGEDDLSPYTDTHAWIFTPSSFQLIILELARLKVTDWRVDRIGSAIGCEFFAWLRRGGAEAAAALTESELSAQRLTLLKNMLFETKEQIEFLTATQSSTIADLTGSLERMKTENETLRAEYLAAQSMLTERTAACDAMERARDALTVELNRTKLERDALAVASAKWFDATIAVTADHNPLTRAPVGRWRNSLRRLSRHRRNLITLANRARDTRKWELAVRYYRDALDLKPDEPGIWVQCGHALKETGKVSEAEVAYRKALDLDAKNADTNAALGHALALQGRSAEAADAYRKALALAPAPSLRRALLDELRGDPAAASN